MRIKSEFCEVEIADEKVDTMGAKVKKLIKSIGEDSLWMRNFKTENNPLRGFVFGNMPPMGGK